MKISFERIWIAGSKPGAIEMESGELHVSPQLASPMKDGVRVNALRCARSAIASWRYAGSAEEFILISL